MALSPSRIVTISHPSKRRIPFFSNACSSNGTI
jgi:hypothetical protein